MSEPRIITGLSEIADAYDAVLCDAWGVIHNGRELFPGAAEATSMFRAERGPLVILTNAPRPSSVIPAQLDRLGLPRDAWDAIVTSGDATTEVIREMSDKTFFRIGPSKDDDLFRAIDVKLAGADEADAIFCSGLDDDQTETPEDYRGLLEPLARRGLPMVCANPDIVVKYGDKLIYCAGAIGQLYEELGGKVILGGKPHAPIYELAKQRMREITGKVPERILVIGDGLGTDVKGANDQGLDCLFVADGIFAEEARANGSLSASKLAAALEENGVHAEYAMDTLAW
ncbi:TIGR01459 family HAD-type hydrolase [Parvularcula lutaonensis]|uniref:TIGR01459 family HAD-type hydrolase n=1 Tax=Parvularcula lutaonensis TaxID=491923 RepID=A0ABV7ME06_9PROT|nr:TIGR01459 family HAD-type hydrolase [Parvularcula lutaonensis]GGY54185.1 hydrolase [Parvularcula lutaonensis]